MIPGGTLNPPLRRVVDAPFTSKSHFGLLAARCLSYMGLGSPLFYCKQSNIYKQTNYDCALPIASLD